MKMFCSISNEKHYVSRNVDASSLRCVFRSTVDFRMNLPFLLLDYERDGKVKIPFEVYPIKTSEFIKNWSCKWCYSTRYGGAVRSLLFTYPKRGAIATFVNTIPRNFSSNSFFLSLFSSPTSQRCNPLVFSVLLSQCESSEGWFTFLNGARRTKNG